MPIREFLDDHATFDPETRGPHMPNFHVDDPKRWRDRADEMRGLALEMRDSETRQIMIRLARDYERLAEKAEERLGSH